MDDVVRIAVALGVLDRRRRPLDVEAVASVLGERWPAYILMPALERAFGWVCGSEACHVVGADVDRARVEEARALLLEENMGDLLLVDEELTAPRQARS